MRGIAASGPMLAQPVWSIQMRNPAARIARAPMPSNSAAGSSSRIASAKRIALDSPDGSPVEKKYLSLFQHAAFGRALEEGDDLLTGARRNALLHRFDCLRDV